MAVAWLNITALRSQGCGGVLVDVPYWTLVLVGPVTDVGNRFVDVVGRDEGACWAARWGLRSPR